MPLYKQPSRSIASYGFFSDIHSAAEKLELCLELVGDVDHNICCGDLLGYGSNGANETINLVANNIGIENCVIGDGDEELLKTVPIEDMTSEMFELMYDHNENLKKENPREAKDYRERNEGNFARYLAISEMKKHLTENNSKFIEKLEDRYVGQFTLGNIQFVYAHSDYYKLNGNNRKLNGFSRKTDAPLRLEKTFYVMGKNKHKCLILGHSHIPFIASMDANGEISLRYVYVNSNGNGKEIILDDPDDPTLHVLGLGSVFGIKYPNMRKRRRKNEPFFDTSKMSFGKMDYDGNNAVFELFVKSVNEN